MFLGELYLSEELFSVVQPVLLVSRVLGIFPVCYKKHGNYYKLRWSTWYAIYSYALCLALTMTTLATLIIDLNKGEHNSIRMRNTKTRFVTCIDISIVIFIVVFGIATLPMKIRKIWKTMNCLNETDKILLLKNSRRFRKSSIYFLVFVFGLTGIIFSYDISSWFDVLQQQSKSPLEYLKAYFCFYCLYVVMLAKELLYWHVIFFVKIKISTLNARLKELKKVGSYTEHPKIRIDRSDLDGWSLNKGIHKVNIISHESVCTSGICLSLDQEITSLTRYQDHIFQAVEVINSTTEYGIHLIMLSCLLHLIITPYFLLVEIFAKGKLIFIILQSIWVLGHLGRVLLIVEPCQLCINEHRKTANLICELLTNELKEQVEKAVILLSLQQSYCKLKFTSCGFFTIKRSLLTSIAGAVTTYLVILIQFNNT